MTIGFTCGSFDLTHSGHYKMLEECKKHCDFLIVGIQEDPSIDRPEKNKPIQTLDERITQIRACRWVDRFITYTTEESLFNYLKDCPYIDIRFLGEDWKGKEFTGHELPLKVIFTPRQHNFSSSSLRERVLQALYKQNP